MILVLEIFVDMKSPIDLLPVGPTYYFSIIC